MADVNVWDDEWQSSGDQPWMNGTRARRLAGGVRMGVSLFEMPPGSEGTPYHFHHGHEETLIVLAGEPTLRTPEGARQLRPGDVVHFVCGAHGAHGLSNSGDAPARYIVASNLASPDAVEYPDIGQVSVMAMTESQLGGPLWDMHPIGSD